MTRTDHNRRLGEHTRSNFKLLGVAWRVNETLPLLHAALPMCATWTTWPLMGAASQAFLRLIAAGAAAATVPQDGSGAGGRAMAEAPGEHSARAVF